MKLFLKKIIGYSALLILLNYLLGFYLKTYEYTDLKENGRFFPPYRWTDYKALEDSIDVLVLGSSHAYRSYSPETIEFNLSGSKQLFNFGSSAQSPLTGYYVLNEVLKKHRPKLIILDIYAVVFTTSSQLKNGRYNLLSMPLENNKLAFFFDGFLPKEQLSLLFFPSYTYKNHFKAKINKLLGRPFLPKKKGTYVGKGYVKNSDTLSTEKLKNSNQFDHFDIKLDQISAKNIDYARKIVEKAREAGIPVVFITSPIPEISVGKIKNYRKISAYFSAFAKGVNVPYYDFNIDRIPAIKDEYHYYDDDHLNEAGANIFSKSIAPILKKEMKQ